MDGELKDVVEMIVDKSGLVQAFRAEATMEAESRAENIQEFLGVAAEFEETHEDIEGTLESLEELRAAGVAGVPVAAPAGATGVAVGATAGAPAGVAAGALASATGVAAGIAGTPADTMDAAMASAAGALGAAFASPAMATAPAAPSVAAMAAAEIERTPGRSPARRSRPCSEWLALRSDLDALGATRTPSP